MCDSDEQKGYGIFALAGILICVTDICVSDMYPKYADKKVPWFTIQTSVTKQYSLIKVEISDKQTWLLL